jgi:hypothetical protein
VRILWVSGIVLALGAPLVVYAACTGPAAQAGGLHWNGSTFQVCDGTSYVSTTGKVSTTTCTGRGGQFDRFGNEQYFCNGTNWVNPALGVVSGTCPSARAGSRDLMSNSTSCYATCNQPAAVG